jgi:serine/threonine protein phosphatase PrpC
MSTDDLSRHPMRHVLTNVVGAREQVEVHVRELDLQPGDRLLLCSDGLHEPLTPARLGAALGGEPDARAAATRLVREALERGTRDNVTALVIEIGSPA